ncbi:pyocin knob domain-containing protein [Paenibacillus sp. MER TA 81-3]|uniref:pyocin knob domain-containing protein n=1 Tax=Paenibacillus sp. MER TA 81-3 TaxID=2939573 RepID=UPI0020406CB1|nr:pyocin knob domain-containing protein [Paenibacillus sp. MER TA 81-3]MCM3338234.1 pyocin knob domain-containing protein [Paenibacillus sp. MER TA 81-3]
MAENRNILIQDDQGNNYYPHGKAKTMFFEDGKTLESRAVAWDGKETPAGAQAKANQAEANTKGYVDGLQTITFAQKTSKNADLNDFKETGIFQLGASANYQNIPQNVDWTVLEVRCARGGYIIQTLTSVTSQRIMYRTRTETETSWSIWRDVLTTLNYEELKQSGVDAKNKVAGAINAKGVPASANDTFDQLAGKIGQIKTEIVPVEQRVSFEQVHAPTVRTDDNTREYIYTVATIGSMKNYFIFSGSIYLDSDPQLNKDSSETRLSAYLEDRNGKQRAISAMDYNRIWSYRYAQNIIVQGRKIYYTATSYYQGSSDAKTEIISGSIPDDFDTTGPVSMKLRYQFYPSRNYTYETILKGRVSGTITAG